jgi:hypothetical protein
MINPNCCIGGNNQIFEDTKLTNTFNNRVRSMELDESPQNSLHKILLISLVEDEDVHFHI